MTAVREVDAILVDLDAQAVAIGLVDDRVGVVEELVADAEDRLLHLGAGDGAALGLLDLTGHLRPRLLDLLVHPGAVAGADLGHRRLGVDHVVVGGHPREGAREEGAHGAEGFRALAADEASRVRIGGREEGAAHASAAGRGAHGAALDGERPVRARDATHVLGALEATARFGRGRARERERELGIVLGLVGQVHEGEVHRGLDVDEAGERRAVEHLAEHGGRGILDRAPEPEQGVHAREHRMEASDADLAEQPRGRGHRRGVHGRGRRGRLADDVRGRARLGVAAAAGGDDEGEEEGQVPQGAARGSLHAGRMPRPDLAGKPRPRSAQARSACAAMCSSRVRASATERASESCERARTWLWAVRLGWRLASQPK